MIDTEFPSAAPVINAALAASFKPQSAAFSLPAARPSTKFLDGLRGLAAVFVLFHHSLLWLHPGYANGLLRHPEQYGMVKRALLFCSYPFRFGHVAVLFFFVLSGFVIHLRYADGYAKGQMPVRGSWRQFLYRRARRLYPPLLLAIVLTFGADRLGTWAGYAIYHSATPYAVINANVWASHSFRTLIGNLFFVQNTYTPVWGTDSPLWSLKYEWWFYAAYPLFWRSLGRSVWQPTLVVGILFIASFFTVIWPSELCRDISSELLVWWLGVLLAEIVVGRLRVPFATLAFLIGLLPIGFAISAKGFVVPDLFWGFGFVGLMCAAFWLSSRGLSLSHLNALKPLGDCSYTLYVIHAPILILASGWLMAHSSTGELPSSFVPALCCVLLIPFAYCLHLLVESPFTSASIKNK